jgi:hypothetical protein
MAQITFFTCSNKKNIYNFIIFVATKIGRKIFSPTPLLVLFLDPGSRMDKNQDPG